MIYLTILMHVKSENEAQFLEMAKPLIEATRKEEGCHAYYLTKMKSEQYNYVLHECWENQASLEAHNKTAHYQKYAPQLGELSEGLTPLVGQKVI